MIIIIILCRESDAIKTNVLLDHAPYCNRYYTEWAIFSFKHNSVHLRKILTFGSGQNPWQTLITYDACFRLCLNAWARGFTEAPLFLSDECQLLRNAFGYVNLNLWLLFSYAFLVYWLIDLKGSCFFSSFIRLHKLLLQPRGFKQVESSGTENLDKACPKKVKKVIGKIRVEGMVFNS